VPDAVRLVLALMLVLAADGARAQDAACRRDVLVAQSSLKVARDDLDKVGDSEAERCGAWRANVATLRRAGAVFGRCLAGRERAERVAEVENPAREFEGLVRERCRGR
jgi:hypothetical protein